MSRNHFTFAVDRLICRASGLPEDKEDEEQEDEEQEDGADGDDDEDGDNEDDEEGLVLLV